MFIIKTFSGGGPGTPGSRKRGASDESGSCSGSGNNSGAGSVIIGSDSKRIKLGEEEMCLDEAIAEIVAVIDDQSKMLGKLFLHANGLLRDIILTNDICYY